MAGMFCPCCLSWKNPEKGVKCQHCGIEVCLDCAFDMLFMDEFICIDCFTIWINRNIDRAADTDTFIYRGEA